MKVRCGSVLANFETHDMLHNLTFMRNMRSDVRQKSCWTRAGLPCFFCSLRLRRRFLLGIPLAPPAFKHICSTSIKQCEAESCAVGASRRRVPLGPRRGDAAHPSAIRPRPPTPAIAARIWKVMEHSCHLSCHLQRSCRGLYRASIRMRPQRSETQGGVQLQQ